MLSPSPSSSSVLGGANHLHVAHRHQYLPGTSGGGGGGRGGGIWSQLQGTTRQPTFIVDARGKAEQTRARKLYVSAQYSAHHASTKRRRVSERAERPIGGVGRTSRAILTVVQGASRLEVIRLLSDSLIHSLSLSVRAHGYPSLPLPPSRTHGGVAFSPCFKYAARRVRNHRRSRRREREKRRVVRLFHEPRSPFALPLLYLLFGVRSMTLQYLRNSNFAGNGHRTRVRTEVECRALGNHDPSLRSSLSR